MKCRFNYTDKNEDKSLYTKQIEQLLDQTLIFC